MCTARALVLFQPLRLTHGLVALHPNWGLGSIMLALRASMIYQLRLCPTANQALHFILQTGIRGMQHHIVVSAGLFADRALLNLEALHAPFDVGELRGVVKLIVGVLKIVIGLARNKLCFQDLAWVGCQWGVGILEFAEIQLRDVYCTDR